MYLKMLLQNELEILNNGQNFLCSNKIHTLTFIFEDSILGVDYWDHAHIIISLLGHQQTTPTIHHQL